MTEVIRPITGTIAAASTVEARDDGIRVRLTWLLVFRAVVVTVLVATAIILRATSTDEILFSRAALALYVIAGTAYLTILGGAAWIRVFRNRFIVAVAYAQLVADALIATALILITGGVESIFVFLYSLSVLNAAIVLERRGAMTIAAVASLLYALVLAIQTIQGGRLVPGILPSFATNVGSFFLVAVLGGYLTVQLSKTSERLKDAQEELERLERLYAAVLGSLPSGVLSLDLSGNIVYANATGVELLGTPALVGSSLERCLPALDAIVRTGQTERFELSTVIPGRGPRVLGGSIAPLVGVESAGRVVVFQDLTELRCLQDEVARAERLAALGRVAAGLAHEVRNPLAAMIGCLQLLRGDQLGLDAESARMLDIVRREAERLSKLVQDFLTYARPAEPRLMPVRLQPLVRETAATASIGLKAVRIDVARVPDLVVRCDADQLRQVLWNVVVNADAVISATGREGVVEISAVAEKDVALIHVDDDGPGVPEDLRQRIFEPFFTTRPEGNGLGLATCQQLMLQNGGGMDVQRSPLGGARFTIRLSLSPKAAPVAA